MRLAEVIGGRWWQMFRSLTETVSVSPNRLHLGRVRVGDIVCLRSGGPKMTVSAIEGEQLVCTWFLKQGQLVEQALDYRLLQPGHERFVVLGDPGKDLHSSLYLSEQEGIKR